MIERGQTSSEHDLVITGADVISEYDSGLRDVGVRGEQISAIAAPGSLVGRSRIDGSGCVLIPGGIDTHTHIDWPIEDHVRSLDGFEDATALAAVSGTTFVIDFVPPTTGSLVAAAHERLEAAAGSVIDFSLHPILNRADGDSLAAIPELAREGMASFKIFTTAAGLGDAHLRRLVEAIGAAGGLAGFHAENPGIIARALRAVEEESGGALRGFARSRPATAESASIALVAHFARELDCPAFIHHVSGGLALDAVEAARRAGAAVRAETCCHYLVFDDSVYARTDAWKWVITPPLRPRESQNRLWAGLREGSIACVASDHCAYGLRHKTAGLDDFRLLPPGAPGLAARMPILWETGVRCQQLSTREFVEVVSTQPARTFGLYPRKGVIRVGADADLVLWDPQKEWTWPAWSSEQGPDYDLYEGRRGSGVPRLTIIRGTIVAKEGRYVGPSGNGQYVPQTIDTRLWR